jgi:hypothetical protein
MKLFNLRKKSKSVKGIIDVSMLLDKAAFEIKYEDGDSIQYSIIDLVKQLDYLDNKMDEKVAANIFFGIMGAFFSLTIFSATILSSNVGVKVDLFKERFQPLENADKELENVDKELENADKELENVDKELAKENQLLKERIIILEQKFK